jgi:hypothetical protein
MVNILLLRRRNISIFNGDRYLLNVINVDEFEEDISGFIISRLRDKLQRTVGVNVIQIKNRVTFVAFLFYVYPLVQVGSQPFYCTAFLFVHMHLRA